MHRRFFAILLTVLIVFGVGSVAAFAEDEPAEPLYLDATQQNVVEFPIRFTVNQASSVNPETTIAFALLQSNYYTDPDDELGVDPALIADFPEIDVSSVTFAAGAGTVSGITDNVIITIPAISQVGIYEYDYMWLRNYDTLYPEHQSGLKLRLTVFETEDGLRIAPAFYVMNDEPVIDPDTGEYVFPEFKVEELGFEYCANEYEISKEVGGSFGDKNKEFAFTVKLEKIWYVNPDEEEEDSAIPLVTIGYSGGTSVSGEIVIEDAVASELIHFSDNSRYMYTLDKEITFTLKHGEKVTFTNIPVGVTLTVTEDDYSEYGYTTTVNGEAGLEAKYFSDRRRPLKEYDEDNGIYIPILDPDTNEPLYQYGNGSAAFVNTKGGDVETGVILENLPYIIAIAVVIAGAVAFLIIRKRRKADEDEA